MGLFKKRTLLFGGLAFAALAGALKNRDRVAGLLTSRSSASEPPEPVYAAPEQTRTPVPDEPAPAPEPSNYDLSGPAENTATPVPAPEPQVTGDGGIDEQAEEEAAAAEAAAIGGEAPAYAGTDLGEPATDEETPVVEAGGGESEGQEQAEALLADNAEPAAGDPVDAERRIADVTEQQEQPSAGETVEPLAPEETREAAGGPSGEQSSFFAGGKGSEAEPEAPAPEEAAASEGAAPGLPDENAAEAAERASTETPAEQKSSAVWEREKSDDSGQDDDTGEWQTWSGRAVDP